MVQFSHLYMTTGKTIALTRCTFVDKVMSLFFNTLSWFVIDFLPRSKSLNFMAAVTVHSEFGAQENKVCLCFHCFPICLPWNVGTGWHDLSFWMFWVSFFALLFHLHQEALLVPLCSLPLIWYHLHIWGYWYFSRQSWFQLGFHQAEIRF